MTWDTVPLGRIAKVDAKAVQPAAISDDTPYVGLEHIGRGGSLDTSTRAATAGLKSAKNLFDPGHILFGKLRPNLAKVARPRVSGVCSTDIYPLRPLASVDRAYLALFLLTRPAVEFASARTTGVNLPRVSWKALAELPVPLPPLPEQRRIAAILDEADALRRTSATGARSWSSLADALLRDVVGAHASEMVPLGAYLRGSQNGLYRPSSDYGSGTRIVRIDSFTGARPGVVGQLKRVRISDEERSKFAIRPGDILLNRVNALSHLGKCTLILEADEPTVFESNMMKLKLAASIEPEFVFAWLRSADARQQIRSRAKKAINQASINQTDVAGLRIPAVPPEIQRVFASQVGSVAAVRELEESRNARLDALFASLQHRAFRGEL